MAGTRDYTNTSAKTNAIPNESFSDLDISFVAHPISGDVAIKKDSDKVEK